jgi:hypothetical protein
VERDTPCSQNGGEGYTLQSKRWRGIDPAVKTVERDRPFSQNGAKMTKSKRSEKFKAKKSEKSEKKNEKIDLNFAPLCFASKRKLLK